ncbi:UDP-N-acetylmuramoyl-tripeptide--D-alanyl-D-alanine ligase [Xenophilus arseniciresistens]|uniref:UDP-N-acetylmuramoyl-tripeptide--D-alanyl-D-alanine ligase n=1 Tax=Xenophilus arseniciresistens TaxID=1283306 RepID=A0AAE3T1Z0_9BURK|nr:UDP-N-acetylmuramoyl-tripeptide--D-alanyl-D-alanine ligase [Xenophilus arseniciresistens]MDA7417877.1 UDP-N-acetylmuramoyl-tripeptide--D-alanyl-D-alanine ligase [Xenophilus arseniciresistens]
MSDTPLFTLAEAAAWLPGARLIGDGATPIARVHTDTRTLAAGDLFVALKGERFDAHSFLPEAGAKGAVAAVAQGGLEAAGLPGLEVDDTLAALGAIGRGWRRRFELPLIAVAGSNGKTTVTQMIASILRAAAPGASLATAGNFNNEIGVPLTLLRLRDEHRLAVVELGMNHVGEIARLTAIAEPTVALVNNAQREHQEFMATVDAVAAENGAVFRGLREGGTAVFPHGDAFTGLWEDMARAPGQGAASRCLRFGLRSEADVALLRADWRSDAQGGAWDFEARTPIGKVQARLHIAGRHNIHNALAAVACALAAGVSCQAIGAGLSAFEAVSGRSRSLPLRWHDGLARTLVDDCYNANPDSVRAAIDVLAELPGPRLLVLGDMGEVGDQGPQFHAEIGAYARERGIEAFYALGEACAHAVSAFDAPGARHFKNIETLNAAVLQGVDAARSVLVKGSRFMAMERVLRALEAAGPAATQEEETGHAD